MNNKEQDKINIKNGVPLTEHPDPAGVNHTAAENNKKPMSAHPDPEVSHVTESVKEHKHSTPTPAQTSAPKPAPAAEPSHYADQQHSKDGSVDGSLTYDDKVIQKIIGISLEDIDGLLTVDGGFFSNLTEKLVNTDNVTSGINTEVGKKQVAVDMDVVVEYGRNIPQIANQVKEVIHDKVSEMTHLEVIEVNINVADIKTKEQFAKDNETVQDKVSSAAETTGQFASKQTEKAKEKVGQGAQKIQEKNEPRVY